jgi:hypothetical protein
MTLSLLSLLTFSFITACDNTGERKTAKNIEREKIERNRREENQNPKMKVIK